MSKFPALLSLILLSTTAIADDQRTVTQSSVANSVSTSSSRTSGAIAAVLSKSKAGNKSPSFTPEREAAALAFVQANHVELAAVLTQLKTMQRAQYENAIRDLFRISEELAKAKDQDPQRYALELQSWQAKSRVQLLAARASVSDDPALEAELRTALERQTDVQISLLQAQRTQATERLKKLSDSLGHLERDRKKQVDKQLAGILRDARRHGQVNKKAHKKPAAQKPTAEKPAAEMPAAAEKPATEQPAAAPAATQTSADQRTDP